MHVEPKLTPENIIEQIGEWCTARTLMNVHISKEKEKVFDDATELLCWLRDNLSDMVEK